MSALAPHVVLLLVLWGTLAALDLVSVPQAMISRPLVAGAVAGWLAGDVEAGLRIGVLLELFALDVLPIGAVRYPDYGPATVVAAALAAGAPWEFGLGLSIGARAGARGRSAAGRLHVRAPLERARDSAARRRARSGRERGHPVAAVRRPARGTRRAARCSPRSDSWPRGRSARWVAARPADRRGAHAHRVGSGLAAAAGGAVRSAGRGAAAQVAPRRRSAPGPCWRCFGDRPVARAAPAARGAGHLELRAHARRRHGLRRRAAAGGSQDRRSGAPRRGGGPIGGVLQLQSQPRRTGARRHGAGRVRSGTRRRRSRGSGPRSAARSARWGTSCSGPAWFRRWSGSRWWLTSLGAGWWAIVGFLVLYNLIRFGPASGRSGPGSTPACGSAPPSRRSWVPRAVARIGPVAGAGVGFAIPRGGGLVSARVRLGRGGRARWPWRRWARR